MSFLGKRSTLARGQVLNSGPVSGTKWRVGKSAEWMTSSVPGHMWWVTRQMVKWARKKQALNGSTGLPGVGRAGIGCLRLSQRSWVSQEDAVVGKSSSQQGKGRWFPGKCAREPEHCPHSSRGRDLWIIQRPDKPTPSSDAFPGKPLGVIASYSRASFRFHLWCHCLQGLSWALLIKTALLHTIQLQLLHSGHICLKFLCLLISFLSPPHGNVPATHSRPKSYRWGWQCSLIVDCLPRYAGAWVWSPVLCKYKSNS